MDENDSDNTTVTPADAPAATDEFTPAETGVRPIKIEDELKQSMIDYSMSVIVGRALPDARDGMKPVHRRCIYAMGETGNTHDKPHKKSARVVGEVMGKYHPHGDSSIYDTIVRMAQPFSMRYKLVDGHGNFGSVDGDGAAAMRYTEVRMMQFAEDMLEDIEKETVDMVSNYDETLEEPTVLPAKLPNLLLNGSMGIAVGMSTNIPPHNLNEICDGVCALLDNPEITIPELMQYIQGPDFPTQGKICGLSGIQDMYLRGRGSLCVRGHAEIIEAGRHEQIVIRDIPYGVNKADMVARIGELIREKKIEGIADDGVRDISKDDVRIEIDLKQDANAQVVLNHLYKLTSLQTTFGAIMLALDHGRPKVMNLKQLLRCYVNHRREVITRRTQYLLRKAEERKHLLEGFRIAVDNIDEIVHIIRSSQNDDEAKARMLERFGLDDVQSSAILEMRLRQLTGMQRQKIEDEYAQVLKNIEHYRFILANPVEIDNIIRQDCADMKKTYGDERKTDIEPGESELDMEKLIPNEPCVITLSRRGYVKRCSLTDFRMLSRGSKGYTGAKTKEEDAVFRIFTPNTHDRILFFTDRGRVYTLKAWELPEADRTAEGKAIQNILKLQPAVLGEAPSDGADRPLLRSAERVVEMLVVPDFKGGSEDVIKEAFETKALVFATRNGRVKKTILRDFQNINRNGIIAISLRENDALIGVTLVERGDELILTSESGRAIRFSEEKVRPMGRAAGGVIGMRLTGAAAEAGEAEESAADVPVNDEDETDAAMAVCPLLADGKPNAVRSLVRVEHDPHARMLMLTESGKGFITPCAEFPLRNRGGMGVLGIRTDIGEPDGNGRLVFAGIVHLADSEDPASKSDALLVVTSHGRILRTSIDGIRDAHRNCKGVRIITLDAGVDEKQNRSAKAVPDVVCDAEVVPPGESDDHPSDATPPAENPAAASDAPTPDAPAES